MPEAPPSCQHCGSTILPENAGGLCSACLWQQLFDDEGPGGPSLFRVPGHQILEEIGRGGGGVVYRAVQREPRREVALKMLHPDQSATASSKERFRLEAEAVSSLQHPGILPTYVFGDYSGVPFFTMQLARGGSLAERLTRWKGRWRDVALLMIQVSEAIHHAHTRGILHRDLKPGNILFDEQDRVYVADFGLALDLRNEGGERAQGFQGTPAYAAPEILAEGARAATTAGDLYSVGAILYELLTGLPPNAAVKPSDLQPAVPKDLEALARCCLATEPERRPASALALAEDLRRWLAGYPVSVRPVNAFERLLHWSRRNPKLAWVSALLIVSLFSGGSALWLQNRRLLETTRRAKEAEQDARQQLQAALINEARSKRKSGTAGQRTDALALLDRAAAIGQNPSLRTEYIATLVRHDFTSERRFNNSHGSSDFMIDVSRDMASFIDATPPGFAEFDTRTLAAHRSYDTRGIPVWYLSYVTRDRQILAQLRTGISQLWDRDTGSLLWQGGFIYGRDAQPAPTDVSTSGKWIAQVQPDHSILITEVRGGVAHRLSGENDEVRGLSFSPDEQVLLVVRRGILEAFEPRSGRVLWTHRADMGPTRPAWSPEGRRVALGLKGEPNAAIFRVADGSVESRLNMHWDEIRLMAFHPNGRLLASVGWDGLLILQDVVSRERLLQREAWVRVLRFSEDGSQLTFSVNHSATAVVGLATIDCLREFGLEAPADDIGCRLAVRPDGRVVASSDFRGTRFWDTATGALLARVESKPVNQTSEREWPALLYVADRDEWWESRRFSLVSRYRIPSAPANEPLHALGSLVEGKPGDLVGRNPATGDLWLVRFSTGELVRWPGGDPQGERVLVKRKGLDGAHYDPVGNRLALRLYPENGVAIIDAEKGTEVARLPSGRTFHATFSPSGRQFVTADQAEYAIWDLATLSKVATWPAKIEGGSYGGATFSPDGSLLAVRQERGDIELRSTLDGTLVINLQLPQNTWVNDVRWMPDGQGLMVLTLGHRVFRWDLQRVRAELQARRLDW